MNFIPLITKFTHLYSNGNSLIDNIFTNFNKDLIYNGILITDFRDHLPIFSILTGMIFNHVLILIFLITILSTFLQNSIIFVVL